jgi:squalene synthase HpnC
MAGPSTDYAAGSRSQPVTTGLAGDSENPGWSRLPAEYGMPERAPSVQEAIAYCERLARSHYENFSVATWFLPKRLQPHFCSVYAYCRISDDLGDEVGDPATSLRLLDEWEAELNATYASLEGKDPSAQSNLSAAPRHPVFIALRETIRACNIPQQPFADLLQAFRQDQIVTRYTAFEDILAYCRFSANPVGRLVLYACGYRDQERQQLSDCTCTALQLANFWQDVVPDYGKGRVYLPLEDLQRFGVAEDDLGQRRATPEFLELMRFQVFRARDWFARGLPLVQMVDRELAIDIELFTRGGQEILCAIERQGYNVLKARPAVSTARKLWLVARAAWKAKVGRA